MGQECRTDTTRFDQCFADDMDGDPWAVSHDESISAPETAAATPPPLRSVPSDGDPWSSDGFSKGVKDDDDPMSMAALDAALPVEKRSDQPTSVDPWAATTQSYHESDHDFASASANTYEAPSSLSSWQPAQTSVDWSAAATDDIAPLPDLSSVRLNSPPHHLDSDPYAIADQPVAISEHPSNSPTVRPVISPLPSRINLTPPALDEDSDGGGFGGFSNSATTSAAAGAAGDDSFGSWGGEEDAWDEPAKAQEPLPSWNMAGPATEQEDAADEGWSAQPSGSLPIPGGGSNETGDDDDWHAAQREIERRDARAPVGKIRRLEQDWQKAVADALTRSTDNDFDGSGLALVGNTMTNASSTLDSLSELPPSATGFRTAYASSLTHAQYVQWLSSATLSPANSLLARVIQEHSRINARRRALDVAEWERRTKQGEADERASSGSAPSVAARPGWGFWRRQPSQTCVVPLTSSSGGMLEVKKVEQTTQSGRSSPAPGPSNMSPLAAASTSSLPLEPTTSASSSRSHEHEGASADVNDPAAAAAAASARGFFGRFRRGRAASPAVEVNVDKEVELSANDLSYLAEVPSIQARPTAPNRGIDDLLSLDDVPAPRASKPATLEQVLSSTSQSGSLGRMPRTTSMPRASPAAAPPTKKASPFDGLMDLDFSPSASPTPTPAPAAAASSSSKASDAFGDSFWNASPLPPSKAATTFASGPSRPPPPQANTASLFDDDDDDGFGDFATSQSAPQTSAKQSSSAFDFSAFESAAPVIYAQPSPQASDPFGDFSAFESAAPTLASNHTQGPASQLVIDAAAKSGRWPSPHSPIPELLPPPPRGNQAAQDLFDFGL